MLYHVLTTLMRFDRISLAYDKMRRDTHIVLPMLYHVTLMRFDRICSHFILLVRLSKKKFY